jgi:hypothetical protein
MSIENEFWYLKISSISSPHIFKCKKTKIEIPFEIDLVKIKELYSTYNPKWEDEDKYYLISRRVWGLGKNLRLYVNELGTEFIIESTY